jgi:hypothetical protein
MWTADAYVIPLTAEPGPALAQRVFDLVWRFDFAAPGFCLLDAGPGVDSRTLRARMVVLADRLAEVGRGRVGYGFGVRAVARFDQQVTTKFHLDGGPDRSALVLGYEPSRVRSRLLLADYSRAAFDRGLTPQDFLREHNPMYRAGEDALAPYVTELPAPEAGRARVVVVNNSSLPFAPARTNPLGVLHKAEILNPDAAERRVVNSILLAADPGEVPGPVGLREFVTTDHISHRDD